MSYATGAVVVIPLERYNELIQLETRASVIVERVLHEKYMSTEDLLWILGTEDSFELAREMRAENEKKKEEREKQRVSEISEV